MFFLGAVDVLDEARLEPHEHFEVRHVLNAPNQYSYSEAVENNGAEIHATGLDMFPKNVYTS